MDDHGQRIIDAIKKAPDMPEEAKQIAYSLTHMLTGLCNDIHRIANALEKQPVQHFHMPPGSTGQIVGDVAKWEPDKWIQRHRGDKRPWKGLAEDATVRVQFDDGRIETHPLNSADVDWREVIAYQIINQE